MSNRKGLLLAIYSKPLAIVATFAFVVMYYLLFYNIIYASNKYGLALITTPIYLIYALIITSAVLLYLSIYSLHLSVYNIKNNISSGISVGTTIVGGIIASCDCQVPILSVILYWLGFNSISVSNVISFVGVYQIPIIVALIAANLIFMYYSLGKLSNQCKISAGKIVAKNSSKKGRKQR